MVVDAIIDEINCLPLEEVIYHLNEAKRKLKEAGSKLSKASTFSIIDVVFGGQLA